MVQYRSSTADLLKQLYKQNHGWDHIILITGTEKLRNPKKIKLVLRKKTKDYPYTIKWLRTDQKVPERAAMVMCWHRKPGFETMADMVDINRSRGRYPEVYKDAKKPVWG